MENPNFGDEFANLFSECHVDKSSGEVSFLRFSVEFDILVSEIALMTKVFSDFEGNKDRVFATPEMWKMRLDLARSFMPMNKKTNVRFSEIPKENKEMMILREVDGFLRSSVLLGITLRTPFV